MKIVIDARHLTEAKENPISDFEELARRLPAMEPSWSWHFLFSSAAACERVFPPREYKNRPGISSEVFAEESGLAGFFSRRATSLSNKLRDLNCDLYFSRDLQIPRNTFRDTRYASRTFACVTSLQDTVRKVKTLSGLKKQSLLIKLRQAVRQSAAVTAPSATSRNDVIVELGLPASERLKVRTIYNGVSGVFSNPRPPSAPPESYGRTILHFTYRPFDKETVVLLKAFSKLVRNGGFSDLRLVCIGPAESDDLAMRSTVENLGCAAQVTFLCGISRQDIARVCAESVFFVNPSSYEESGDSIAEAMAFGLPVICCNSGAQGEIVKDAAIKIAADDVQSLADAMKYLASNPKSRAILSERGKKTVSEYTWDRTATSLLALFRAILKDTGVNNDAY